MDEDCHTQATTKEGNTESFDATKGMDRGSAINPSRCSIIIITDVLVPKYTENPMEHVV